MCVCVGGILRIRSSVTLVTSVTLLTTGRYLIINAVLNLLLIIAEMSVG